MGSIHRSSQLLLRRPSSRISSTGFGGSETGVSLCPIHGMRGRALSHSTSRFLQPKSSFQSATSIASATGTVCTCQGDLSGVRLPKLDLAKMSAQVRSAYKQQRKLRKRNILAADDYKKEFDPRKLFKWAIMCLRYMIRGCNKIREIAAQAGFDSLRITAIREKAKQTGGGSEVFDANSYKVEYEFKWPRDAGIAIAKQPSDRTPEDIKIIAKVARSLLCFRKYTRPMQELMGKVMTLGSFEKNRVILRKGHVGYCFYLIFSGAVCIILDKDETTAFTKQKVNVLRKGMAFGEIALLHHVRRGATVMCVEETQVLIVDKKNFYEYNLHLHLKAEINYKVAFLRNHHLFADWDLGNLEKICEVSQLEALDVNTAITTTTSDLQWYLVISQGQCEEWQVVDLTDSPELKQYHREQLKKRTYEIPEVSLTPPPSHISATKVVHSLHSVDSGLIYRNGMGALMKVNTLFPGQVFGINSMLNEPSPNIYVISKGCEAIRVPKANFMNMKTEETLTRMRAFIHTYPSNDDLLRAYKSNNIWKCYKQNLINDFKKRGSDGKLFSDKLRKYTKAESFTYRYPLRLSKLEGRPPWKNVIGKLPSEELSPILKLPEPEITKPEESEDYFEKLLQEADSMDYTLFKKKSFLCKARRTDKRIRNLHIIDVLPLAVKIR